jgi:hypothetical protein
LEAAAAAEAVAARKREEDVCNIYTYATYTQDWLACRSKANK